MGIRVGIDIGATYSKIAFVDADGFARGIENMEGASMTPSIVYFESSNEVIVGEAAKEMAYIEPENTISGIKKYVGKPDWTIECCGQNIFSEEILSLIIKKMTDDASIKIGDNVTEAVITVPVYWGINECTAIKRAGEIAGLNIINVLTETTAAAIAYGFGVKEQEQTVLIFDLGGSELNVAVATVSSNEIKVVCTDGCEIGGKDWDDAVMSYLESEFCSETGFDGDFDEYAQQDLCLKAERVKRQLSHRLEVPVIIDAAGLRTRVTITRSTFDEITQNLLNETIQKTDFVVEFAKSKGYEIDKILLVGGSTRMPQVTEKLCARYGIAPEMYEPELAIAKGAAIYATMDLNNGLKQVSPKSYALRVIVKGEETCQNIIIKNWQFSDGQISVKKEFCIADNGLGKIDLQIYESEHLEDFYPVDENLKLATISFNSLTGGLLTVIQVEIRLTVDGVLDVICKNYDNGEELAKVTFGTNSKLKNIVSNVKYS